MDGQKSKQVRVREKWRAMKVRMREMEGENKACERREKDRERKKTMRANGEESALQRRVNVGIEQNESEK